MWDIQPPGSFFPRNTPFAREQNISGDKVKTTAGAAPLQRPRCYRPVPISPPNRAGTLVPPSPRPPRVPGAWRGRPAAPTHCAHSKRMRFGRGSRAAPEPERIPTTHPPRDQRQPEPEAVRGPGGSARRPAGNRQAPPAAPSQVAATSLGDSCCPETPRDRGTRGNRGGGGRPLRLLTPSGHVLDSDSSTSRFS